MWDIFTSAVYPYMYIYGEGSLRYGQKAPGVGPLLPPPDTISQKRRAISQDGAVCN